LFEQSSIVKVKAIVVDEIDRDNPPHALLVGALVWPTFATGFLETGAIDEEMGVTRRASMSWAKVTSSTQLWANHRW
jgi:hypothetical protein